MRISKLSAGSILARTLQYFGTPSLAGTSTASTTVAAAMVLLASAAQACWAVTDDDVTPASPACAGTTGIAAAVIAIRVRPFILRELMSVLIFLIAAGVSERVAHRS